MTTPDKTDGYEYLGEPVPPGGDPTLETVNPAEGNGNAVATPNRPALHIDIQVHIDPTSSAEQIDHIFASMARHFYRLQVEEIRSTPSWSEPFDLEAFLNDPNPKIFRSGEIIRASEPFEVDEFNRIIREGRDV